MSAVSADDLGPLAAEFGEPVPKGRGRCCLSATSTSSPMPRVGPNTAVSLVTVGLQLVA